MSTQPVIQTVGLTKVFRDFWRRARVRAVSDLDLRIEPGEVYGLLGPNGSGKSTTIKMILGLLYPTRGWVSVFGRPPDDVRTKARIGYLPEESYLYRFLNGREILDYYGTLFQIPRPERRRRTEELLEMVGLRPAARRSVGEYSKGMARRIGLAQALINDPDLLILDEPTSGLDPIGSKLVKDIIVRIGRHLRKTILLSSHLLADVEEVCDRVTILYGGQVQVSGPLDEILNRRDMIQMTCEQLAPATLSRIREMIEVGEGKELKISTPRDRLEELFLRIVDRAREQQIETSGSAPAGAIAGFLGAEQEGRRVLEQLVKTAPEPVSTEPPPPAPGTVDTDVLDQLVTQRAAPPAAAAPSAARAGSGADDAPPLTTVDRSVLNELTQGDKEPPRP